MEKVQDANVELRSEMFAAKKIIQNLEEDFHTLCKSLKSL